MGREGERLARWSEAVRESSRERFARVAPLEVNFRPTAGALSIADLAHHLVEADRWLFAKLVDPTLSAMVAHAGEAGEVDAAGFAELLAELDATGRERSALLRGMDEAAFDRPIVDERFGGEVTVWWTIVRGNLDHEAHHRGQLATYLRLLADRER